MSRIAIVGVEGSGKTVLMAAFGEKYMYPDKSGVFLEAKDQNTCATVGLLAANMREGRWPSATGKDSVTSLDWSLCRRKTDGKEVLCDISFLDYGGEIYRLAFGNRPDKETSPYAAEISTLKNHILEADALVVLVNLKDIISGSLSNPRTLEMLWITKGIVDCAAGRLPEGRILLAFSQYGTYRSIVAAAGGLRGVYSTYLGHMQGPYPNLPLLAVSAVDRVRLTPGGHEVPEAGFSSEGLDSLMEWIASDAAYAQRRKKWTRRGILSGLSALALGGGYWWLSSGDKAVSAPPVSATPTRLPMGKQTGPSAKLPRQAGEVKTLTLPGGAEMRFRWCPAGTFTMGSPESEDGRDGDETQHQVTLTRGFWLGETPVTQKQWKSVMGDNPSVFKGANLPVEEVSWNDCQEFIQKVNAALNCGARLPTEAEWEYACRAGTSGAYGGTGELDELGWYDKNSGDKTHPVGQKKPNAWGLYDMHGNVWEWCSDWYGDYPSGSVTDPTGPSSGSSRVLRGGSWGCNARDCRSASRGRDYPGFRDYYGGFRLLCSAGPHE